MTDQEYEQMVVWNNIRAKHIFGLAMSHEGETADQFAAKMLSFRLTAESHSYFRNSVFLQIFAIIFVGGGILSAGMYFTGVIQFLAAFVIFLGSLIGLGLLYISTQQMHVIDALQYFYGIEKATVTKFIDVVANSVATIEHNETGEPVDKIADKHYNMLIDIYFKTFSSYSKIIDVTNDPQ